MELIDVYVTYTIVSFMILRITIGLLDEERDCPFIGYFIISAMMVTYGFYLVFVGYERQREMYMPVFNPNNRVYG